MSLEEKSDSLYESAVLALENSAYKWRTLGALSKETGISEAVLLEVFQAHSEEIVRSTSAEGEALYTTRKHLRERSSVVERLSRALRNRGA